MIITAIVLIALLIAALVILALIAEIELCHEHIETLWAENEGLCQKNAELRQANLMQRTTIDFLMEDDNGR